MRPVLLLAGAILLASCKAPAPPGLAAPSLAWKPAIATQPVTDDPDDPAIWIHPTDPALSLVVGTNKVAAPSGALVVFDLEGKILQTITGLDRPNNVDIRQDVEIGGRRVDVAVVTERLRHALRFYSVDAASRRLTEIGSAPVFAGETGEFAEPMGIALYKRPGNSALFAVVGRKTGPADGYLWQYRVKEGPTLELVRKFGKFSGTGEIESIVVDDRSGFVYYSDEGAGIHKYYADPDHPSAPAELTLFGKSGYHGDREGLAIYSTGEYTGFLISTDQIEGASRYLLYRREGAAGAPHDHNEVVAVIESGADATDGLEVTSVPLGPRFPNGLLVTMNSGARNFLYFAWSQP